jgi:DNA primase
LNIIDFCREHGIEFREPGQHHHCTDGYINIDCPRCSPGSGKFRLGWNVRGGFFHCWSCGKLSTISIWAELSGRSYKQVRQLFKDSATDDVSYEPPRPPGKLKLPRGIKHLQGPHIKYLTKRGFSSLQIADLQTYWKIQGIDWHNPALAWRIFIPVIIDGETISWTTRAIGDSNPRRYITARDDQQKFSIKDVLYGVDYCQHSIVVVEGPIDVWKIGPGAVALMGLDYSQSQLYEISRFRNRYICLDSTNEAQDVARRLCNEIKSFPGNTFNIRLRTGKDPGECSDEELKKIRECLQ